VGFSIFGKFQTETPWWQMTLKWIIIMAVTYGMYFYFGEIGAFSLLGVACGISIPVHIIWCKRNGIHLLKATPRKKYYQLRHWEWTE
jgi:hypothetical protein